jgi:hypothetical protein
MWSVGPRPEKVSLTCKELPRIIYIKNFDQKIKNEGHHDEVSGYIKSMKCQS